MAPTSTETSNGAGLSPAGFDAWRSFLRAHSRLMRKFDQDLRDQHGVTLGDFDVLVQLAEAAGGRLRMCELADAVLLSPSGLSRRVDRLERAGMVERRRASADARNVEAKLTPAGKRLLRRLRHTHRGGVRDELEGRFDADELETLAELLGRLAVPGG